jgi:hypothetical protein
MRNKYTLFLLFVILFAISCGTESGIDDSTKEDWETNLKLWNEYSNKLIFTATETTSPTGKKEVSLVANNREALVFIFERLELAGVPSMHERRMHILELIEQAPGSNRVDMSGKLATYISNFWEDILRYARKHGVTPKE